MLTIDTKYSVIYADLRNNFNPLPRSQIGEFGVAEVAALATSLITGIQLPVISCIPADLYFGSVIKTHFRSQLLDNTRDKI